MDSICVHCNEDAYDQDEQVCTACGIVTEGIQFSSDLNNPHSSNSNFKLKHWRKKRTPSGLLYAISILQNLCKLYNIKPDIKAEILELLKSVHSKTSFRYKQDIGIMAGCCLLHVQKKYQLPIPPISDLCSKLECSKKQVFRYNKFLKFNFEDCAKSNYISTASDNTQKESDECSADLLKKLESLIRVNLSSIPESSKVTLIFKTTALIKLAYSCWIVTGRSPDSVISAAAFLCWKSMNPSCKKLSFKRFCSDFSLSYHKSQCRVTEMKRMLLKLGQGIPSFTKNYVHDRNVLFHLDYILENSETLRNDLLSEEFTVDEIEKKEFSTFRQTIIKKKKETDEVETCVYDSDMCASDVAISDTEIDSYIRTEEQIEMIKNLRVKKNC